MTRFVSWKDHSSSSKENGLETSQTEGRDPNYKAVAMIQVRNEESLK